MNSAAVELSEKLLSGAGGWQAMKTARELVKAGRVSNATYEPPVLAGEVRDGKNYRAGLRLRSTTDVENICTCRESREWGKICAHSLAVGLSWLTPPAVASATAPSSAGIPKITPELTGPRTPVALHFILPPNFSAAWSKGKVMVCLEAEFNGRRTMLDALPPNLLPRYDEQDEAILEQLKISLGRNPAGMNLLSPGEFLQLLSALREHPQITFGRAAPARVSGKIYRPLITITRAAGDRLRLATKAEGFF